MGTWGTDEYAMIDRRAMQYSPTSTTYVTSSRSGQQPNALHLVARGPTSPSPMTLSPLPFPHHGLHNMSPPQQPLSYDHTANWDRAQPPPNHTMPLYGNTIPLPAMSPGSVEINPALEFHPMPLVDWDITCPSSFAVMNTRRGTVREHSSREPATRPSISLMTIHTPFSRNQPIVIHHPYGEVITVYEVLTRVHEHLRACALALATSPSRPIPGLLDAHQQYGMVSDAQIQCAVAQLLGRATRWQGLALVPGKQDEWQLHVR